VSAIDVIMGWIWTNLSIDEGDARRLDW